MKICIELLKTVLGECVDDYVGLWSIIREVESYETDPEGVKRKTLGLIFYLLKNGFVMAGTPSVSGVFINWDRDAIDIIHAIKYEWKKLGHKPDIGDIVWFTATKSGEEELRKLEDITALDSKEIEIGGEDWLD